MRIGISLPIFGVHANPDLLVRRALQAQDQGYDGVWLPDHIANPVVVQSRYPYSKDGINPLSASDGWLDSVVALGLLAARTQEIGLGIGVLAGALRHPIVLAKQIAAIDLISPGRLSIGIGAGWLQEEFLALGVDFKGRGGRLDEWLEIVRTSWSGQSPGYQGNHYHLVGPMNTQPAPIVRPRLLVGGVSRRAVDRAIRLADGWFGNVSPATINGSIVAEMIGGGMPPNHWNVLRLPGASGYRENIVRVIPELEEIGIKEIVVDADWSEDLPDGGYWLPGSTRQPPQKPLR